MVIQYKDDIDKHIYKDYPFELSNFQKCAIRGIDEGHHVLVPAPTGSGKTLPAEYGIEKFVAMGKKVIYTSPIKSLSNQKFHEFSKTYEDISFGILTGDNKYNPEGDVLIMTTEILRNNLFNKKENMGVNHFSIDLENDLYCVIFDEIHYINDSERGKVWEESIIMLRQFKNVQMIMLSATIDKPELFCKWVESNSDRQVVLTDTCMRVVPLKHHYYIPFPNGMAKKYTKEEQSVVLSNTNKAFDIKTEEQFTYENYNMVKNVTNILRKYKTRITPQFALNTIVKMLKIKNLLPCICFVFNRKNVEKYASMMEEVLFNQDESKKSSLVRDECFKIISKLPNYNEFTQLGEYETIIKLLEKGVAIHHAGLLPIVREMIEIMFSKGYVKLLFATETFAVGINLPTKSVIFSGIEKFDGRDMRVLHGHEYTQMAGRAGRRGLDKIGHVYHLNGLFELPMMNIYKSMVDGGSQMLQSKFKIHPGLVLRLINEGNIDIEDFCKHSNAYKETNAYVQEINDEITDIDILITKKKSYLGEYEELINQYHTLIKKTNSNNKKSRISGERELVLFKKGNNNIDKVIAMDTDYQSLLSQKDTLEKSKYHQENRLKQDIDAVLDYLDKYKFIEGDTITNKGLIACNIQECHCLAFGEYIYNGSLFDLNEKEILCVVSCLNGLKLKEPLFGFKDVNITSGKNLDYNKVSNSIKTLVSLYQSYDNYECDNLIENECYALPNYDLIEFIANWYDVTCVEEAKKVIFAYCDDTDVFIGELIKNILKIVNIIDELIKIYESNDDHTGFLNKLMSCKEHIMKFIVNNQSLYLTKG